MIIGIDTGVSGGMALMDRDGVLIECCDVPHYWETMKSKTKDVTLKGGKIRKGKFKRRKRIDYGLLHSILCDWKVMGADVLFLEKVSAQANNGVVAAFSFGESMGCFKALVISIGFECHLVTPQEWKKYHGLIVKKQEGMTLSQFQSFKKAHDLDYACKLFGGDLFKKVGDHNKAEAALIAAYGVEMLAAND